VPGALTLAADHDPELASKPGSFAPCVELSPRGAKIEIPHPSKLSISLTLSQHASYF